MGDRTGRVRVRVRVRVRDRVRGSLGLKRYRARALESKQVGCAHRGQSQ